MLRSLYDNDDKIADKRLEQVLEAINHDSIFLEKMFSENALAEADDFDGQMEYLFDFFQGDVQSWERDTGPLASESIEYGSKTKELKSWYSVNVDKQKYLFFS